MPRGDGVNRLDQSLSDLLDPVRDMAVAGILETMAAHLRSGADVRAEPKLRDPDGLVRREGVLALPRRADLAITKAGRTLIQRVEGTPLISFTPVTLSTGSGLSATIAPFHWDAAEVRVEARQLRPSWSPLRHWFLEWFQSRYAEVAPDLDGSVHAIDGPRQTEQGWEFLVDFGSAPVQCVPDMIEALATTGASRVQIGQF